MPRKSRKSCGEYIADRAAANKDRQVEQLFSELEQSLIDRAKPIPATVPTRT